MQQLASDFMESNALLAALNRDNDDNWTAVGGQ